MTKPNQPSKSDRAYALHLMAVDSEGISRRLGVTQSRARGLVHEGRKNVERRAAAMLDAAE